VLDIDADADGNQWRLAQLRLLLNENAGGLGAIDQHIIRPFQADRGPPVIRQAFGDCLINRQRNRERQKLQICRRRGDIGGIKVARLGHPVPVHAPASLRLLVSG
jgi:hypothetical protein